MENNLYSGNEKKLLIFTFIVLILIFISFVTLLIFLGNIGASTGKHTGFVTAIEFNENILWNANLVYFKTDTESTQEDIYCVNDEITKLQLEEYSKKKEQITIQYQNPFWFWRSLCNGGVSIITGVEK